MPQLKCDLDYGQHALIFPPEQHLKDSLPIFLKDLLRKTFNYVVNRLREGMKNKPIFFPLKFYIDVTEATVYLHCHC